MTGKIIAAILMCTLLLGSLAGCGRGGEGTPASGGAGSSEGTEKAEDSAAGTPAGGETAQSGLTGKENGSGSGSTAGSEAAAESSTAEAASSLSPEMKALDQQLREEIGKKRGKWSLYVYRFDTGEEIAVNAEEPMISASLIKLYVAGCYLEEVEEGKVSDNYQNQLFAMISASDNGATNQLIDVLGMEQINDFMERHDYKAGQLNRKMLAKGKENYTSAGDCGRVLRRVYEWSYINPEASRRVMGAMLAQIERNRHKIPAGVPDSVWTANKTGELFTKDENGVSVSIQNDAAVIFAPDHPYVMAVMSAVPSGGEAELHREIAELSAEVFKAICGDMEQAEEAETGETAETAESGETAAEAAEAAETGKTAAEADASAVASTEAAEAATEAGASVETGETAAETSAEAETSTEEATASEASAETGEKK